MLVPVPNTDEIQWANKLSNQKSGKLIFPVSSRPDGYIISRFIAKIGLEALAFNFLHNSRDLAEIVNMAELDELRNYVRRGHPKKVWPFSFRHLYPPNFVFDDGHEQYQVLHEFDILLTEENELYIVVAIFGDEYVLNLGGPEIDGYEQWLQKRKGQSYLYSGKIDELF